MKKILLTSLLILLTVGCGFPSIGSIIQSTPAPSQPQSSATERAIPPTAVDAASTTQQAATRPTVSPEQLKQITDKIQQQVIAIRGLQPKQKELKQDTLTPAELEENVKNDFFKDYTQEDAKSDVRELAAFGLLPQGFDLYKLYIDLYSEQVAGYYDPKTKDMFVVQANDFTGSEKMTYAHEYTHVLQDQTWDIENGLKSNDEYCKTHSEYCAGVQALLEGDASLSEQFWFFTDATQQDQQDVQNFYTNYTSPIYDSAPLFLQKDLVFPYDQGTNFVQTLYDSGNWAAVDKAYENPPSSTEMILHPEKYPSDKPVDVPLNDVTSALGSGWKETSRNTMGEWYLSLILSAGDKESTRLDEETAATAAAGWAGDTYTVNWNESSGQLAVILRSRWDTAKDADEFWKALGEYGQKRWGSPISKSSDEIAWSDAADHFVKFFQDGQDIWWVMAPDQATADKIAAAAK